VETFSLDLSIENVNFKQIFFLFFSFFFVVVVLRFIANTSIIWIFSNATIITGTIFILIAGGEHVIGGLLMAMFIVEYENLIILMEKDKLSIVCISQEDPSISSQIEHTAA